MSNTKVHSLQFKERDLEDLLIALDDSRTIYRNSIIDGRGIPEFAGMLIAWQSQLDRLTDLYDKIEKEMKDE